MTPVSLNPPEGPSLIQAGQNQFCISPNNQDPRAFFNIFDPRRQTIEINGGLRDQNDHQDHKLVLHEGSSSNHQLYNSSFNSPQPAMHDPRTARGPNLSYSRMEEEDSKSGHGSAKWMSSKMRLMKKMMRPSSSPATHKAINSTTTTSPRFQNHRYGNRYSQRSPRNNNSNNTTRVCSDCKTSTTPLWRSGPLGPKSLCNACGIRQRKARRAMMEAENGLATPMNATSTKTRVHNKVKKPRTNHFAQFKNNKYKFTTATTASSSSEGAEEKVECFATNLRNNSDFQEAFTWDEKVVRAALLLMDLSCGLVHSN